MTGQEISPPPQYQIAFSRKDPPRSERCEPIVPYAGVTPGVMFTVDILQLAPMKVLLQHQFRPHGLNDVLPMFERQYTLAHDYTAMDSFQLLHMGFREYIDAAAKLLHSFRMCTH